MKSFFQFLNEIAADSQSMVSNQPISALIQRNFPMGALNYDFSDIPPTAPKNKTIRRKFYYKLENNEFLKLSDVADIKINFPEANFWLTRKGSIKEVGRPTKDFNKEKIGIKVTSDKIDPNYLFYMFQYLHTKSFFEKEAVGMLNLKNIRVSTIKDIQLKLND
jgi:hypothetical protein